MMRPVDGGGPRVKPHGASGRGPGSGVSVFSAQLVGFDGPASGVTGHEARRLLAGPGPLQGPNAEPNYHHYYNSVS